MVGKKQSSTPARSRLRIRQARKAAGMTQAELAETMGRDQSTINRWERGVMEVGASDLVTMADLFGCAVGQLFEDGDGLTGEERDLVGFLRANPVHRKLLLGQLELLKETVPPVAAE